MNQMLKRAQEIKDRITGWRRDIHMHPELGFQEARTAALVAEQMESLGYRVKTGVGRTGVVADRGEGGPVVAIRADIDALPLQEANETPYASQVPGVMHACGHDAHTAIALGVATLLASETFPGTVRFLFQPAEEVGDEEGISGAPRMIEDGAMEGVDAVLALHVDSDIETGNIATGSGPVTAGVDTLHATIVGQGGHGAHPHETVDPVYLAAHVILALHGIASRRIDPFEPSVISVGAIHGGQADNVIPQEVEIKATIRYMEPEVQQILHTEIVRALSVARALGGDFEHSFEIGYPPMYNNASASDLIETVANDLLGEDHLSPAMRSMGAEDFGFFSKLAPGAMFSLGCLINGDKRVAHNPRFDIDEACLPIGAAILAEAALRLLRREVELQ
jgi:amidohydrolase